MTPTVNTSNTLLESVLKTPLSAATSTFKRCCRTLTLLLICTFSAASYASSLQIISQPNNGAAVGNGPSLAPDTDDSGDVIVFASTASDLVENDSGPLVDVFVYTRESRGLTNLTRGGNGNSGFARISGDGRYVVFASSATNLTADPQINGSRLFLYDRQTDQIQAGPRFSDFTLDASVLFETPNYVESPVIDAGGDAIAFLSHAADVMPGLPRSVYPRLYVWYPNQDAVDTLYMGAGSEVNNQFPEHTPDIAISDNGRYFLFSSAASNLRGAPQSTLKERLYRFDIGSPGQWELLLNGIGAIEPKISRNGRHITFLATAVGGQPADAAFIDGDPNRVFSLDTQTNQVTLIDRDMPGSPPRRSAFFEGSFTPDISTNGRFITFVSRSRNIVSGDTEGAGDVFRWDRDSGAIVRLTEGATRDSSTPRVNADGSEIVFATAASNLTNSLDDNGSFDILNWREDPDDFPTCAGQPAGVLSSSSGVQIRTLATDQCLGSGQYSYGQSDALGLVIPAATGRAELNLVPGNEQGLPENELVFFTYPASQGETFYATEFVARGSGHVVRMTFQSSSAEVFKLQELIVFEPGEASRRRVAYREAETQWTFVSEGGGGSSGVEVLVFLDENDDGVREPATELGLFQITTTLFHCFSRDGLVGSVDTAENGVAAYVGLEPDFYQLAVRLGARGRFSTQQFDSGGSLVNVIQTVVDTPDGVVGYSGCTYLDGNGADFAPIGVLQP